MAGQADNPNAVPEFVKSFRDDVDLDPKGMSPLHEATLDDSVLQINEALEAGHDLNARDLDGATPLHWAAAGNSHQAVERLIEAGADPNLPSDADQTPLHWGAAYGATESIDRLLKAGADFNARDDVGDTPLHKAGLSPLSPEAVERLLEAGADPNARNNQQETPLHQAHFQLAPDTVERLLKAGADPEARDGNGDTPLHRATVTRARRSMDVLLKAGANPDSRDADDNTPLHDAALIDSPECASRLIEAGADPDPRNADGKTPLLIASHHPSGETVERLLDAGADHDARENDLKSTPLHEAATHGALDAADRLLAAGADPDARDVDGETPLHRAAFNLRDSPSGSDMVKHLIEGGADPDLADSQRGRTPLNLAAVMDNQEAIKPLLEAGANTHIQDHEGHTALMQAAAHGPTESVERLLKAGADPHIHGVNRGDTALMRAASYGHTESVDRLLKAGADPDARDNDGASALHHAAGADKASTVDRLIKGGAHHQAIDHQEQTPLHVAAKADASECVNRLLKAGAETHVHDTHGRTPLELARESDSHAAASRLEQAAVERQSPPRQKPWSRARQFVGQAAERVAAWGKGGDRTSQVPEQQPERQPTRTPESVQADANSPSGESAARKQPSEQRPDKSDAVGNERSEQRQQQLPAAARPQQRNRPSKPDRPDKQRSGARPEGGSKKSTSARKFAEDASERCIKLLEKGVAPWQKGWDRPTDAPEPPHNPVSKTRYKGLNTVVLRSVASERGYSDPRWLTYNQARQIGAQVRKGERGTTVEYWKFPDPKAEGNEPGKPGAAEKSKEPEQRRIIHRTYTVFNAEQCDKMKTLEKEPKQPQRWETCERAERLLESSGARIEHKAGDMAYYHPKQDKIVLPKQEQFRNPEAYYSTAMHELGHWTGHENRMNRETLTQGVKDGFNSDNYAKEELRAEMTSMTVNGVMKLPHDPERHAAYVGSWIKALKDDPNELRHAARDAGRMADYILEHDRDRPREVSQAPRRAGDAVPTPERQMAMQNEQEKGIERTSSVALSR